MSPFVVGLTGGIGSGKSTVADLFVARGATLVDTDAIAHELTAPGGAAMPALIAAFGPGIADARGALDRAAMRRHVFADPAARARLEGLLHPLIRDIAEQRCHQATTPYAILAVPLLVESGAYRERCDRIAVVDCPEAQQIARVMDRSGLPATEVAAIMAAQASRAARRAMADDLIDNSGDPALLAPQIDALDRVYRSHAANKLQANC